MRNILHFPDKYINGISNLTGPHMKKDGSTFEPVLGLWAPFDTAMSTEFPTDAHFVTYCIQEPDGSLTPCPLLRKQAYHHVKAARCDVVAVALALDFDTPGHVPLDDTHLGDIFDRLTEAWEKDARLANWAAWYTTRHGARVVYVLDRPVPAPDSEARMITLQRAYKTAGIEPDASCVDWTRRFRLPLVVRDGMHTGLEALHMLNVQDVTVEVDSLPPSPRKMLARLRTFTKTDRYPDQDECNKRLWNTGKNGRPSRTRFHDRARAALKDSPLYMQVFDGEPLPDDGRHGWLLTAFGIAVPRLLRSANAAAEDIFALFYDPILQWDPASCDEDPHAHAWDILQHIYEQEVPNYNREQEIVAERLETAESVTRRMVEGIRGWCDAPEIGTDTSEEVQIEYLRRHLFANTDRFFFPMNEHGRYMAHTITKEQIIPHIRTTFLRDIVPTTKYVKGETESDVSAVELVNKYSTIVRKVRGVPQSVGDGYITNADGTNPELVLPMYRRNPYLTPRYDKTVDGWLLAFFGDGYERAREWIGHALAFEEGPICALSISGPPSIGKKLLVNGLSETLEYPRLIPGRSIGAKHAEELLHSPFVNINESWPAMDVSDSPADRFKEMTGGDNLAVEPKFKACIEAVNPLRIILTANGHALRDALVRGRNMSPEEKEAIGIRILHFDLDDGGRRYLEGLGGRTTTECDGARWIRGESGEPSDFVVARHYLWLYENRQPWDRSQRLCVMGNCDETSEQMGDMSTQGEEMPKVMRGMLSLLNTPMLAGPNLKVEGGRVLVTRMAVLNAIRAADERVKEGEFDSCLSAIMRDAEGVEIDGRVFVDINTDIVLQYGRHWGMDTKAARRTLGMVK